MSLFDSSNAAYVQALYEEFARNPEAIPDEWRSFFAQGVDVAREAGLIVPEALMDTGFDEGVPKLAPTANQATAAAVADAENVRRLFPVVARAAAYLQAFREHGHQLAQIDPLGSQPPGHPQLDPSFFGTSREELEEIPASVVLGGDTDETLGAALLRLEKAYCGSIGYEFEHLEDPDRVSWLWEQVETGAHTQPLPDQEQLALLKRLTQVEGLEQFLHKAYLGQKRFSIEGTDMLVPMLDLAIEGAAEQGAEQIVMGMAHRGRLNVLAHGVCVPYEEVIGEFEGGAPEGGSLYVPDPGTGDVKYHHGAVGTHEVPGGGQVTVRLAPNPSHLEFVNPVVMGMARARQYSGDGRDAVRDPSRVVPILIHGDAAFAAEGVVAETLNLARLEGYTTGGTVHLLVNNQIGFTTSPRDGRSTRYSSDLAKGYDVPVVHVNADDPEACLSAMRLGMEYRRRYHDDFVIDLVGYRRHGHNEGDEPAYTHPRTYERIRSHPTVRSVWADTLVGRGGATAEQVEAVREEVSERLREAQDRAKTAAAERVDEPQPEGDHAPALPSATPPVGLETLSEINEAAVRVPDGFTLHPKLARQLRRRTDGFDPELEVDWGHAEALALGSVLKEGIPVRLSGQDSQRGTFSHRHMVLHDVETGEEHVPLDHLDNARLEVYNSPLSETAALAFEYGYCVAADRDMVLWEAQFGDFVNVAQPILDQFVSSGRAKWNQQARLTLLLPHGYEGQGPEHSSARLERFLQLCAEDNIRVVYPTTPAQYFHLLRSQAHAPEERPLVVMTPKSLLRLPQATSRVRELTQGDFRAVIDDPDVGGRTDAISRLVLCSGKFFYDLELSGRRGEAAHTAIVRVERLYPFPTDELADVLAGYPALTEVFWAQEEPRNMGALAFVGPRLRAVVPRSVPLRYVARPERASPAEGKGANHVTQQERLVRDALALEGDTG
jgi:2-oxoglutarate dehydrogenase E1 component